MIKIEGEMNETEDRKTIEKLFEKSFLALMMTMVMSVICTCIRMCTVWHLVLWAVNSQTGYLKWYK